MKNLFKSTLILLIASIAITSCKNNMSLTKRHYRKGYFVQHSNKPSTTNLKTIEAIKNKPEILALKQTNAVSINQESVFANADIRNTNKINLTSGNNLAIIKNNYSNKIFTNSVKNFIPINLKINNQKFNINKSKEIIKNDRGGDARSFFWTIILLIIIIWAIAVLLGGVSLGGGLINLLLLIALIFFILWLLRVV